MRKTGRQSPPVGTNCNIVIQRNEAASRQERRQRLDENLAQQGRRRSDQQQKEFGLWLAEVRKSAGRTQDKCCEAFNEWQTIKYPQKSDILKSDWSRIENGHVPLPTLYDKIEGMGLAVRVPALLMYQKAYLNPPDDLIKEGLPLSASETQLQPATGNEQIEHLEKLVLFCTNRILAALGHELVTQDDLAQLK